LDEETTLGEKLAGLPSGFEALHPPLPLAGGLICIFRLIV
jgi:hypothetical protein